MIICPMPYKSYDLQHSKIFLSDTESELFYALRVFLPNQNHWIKTL